MASEPVDLEPLKDAIIQIYAHSVLLVGLIEKAKKDDSGFPDFIRDNLHAALGRHLEKLGHITDVNTQLRETIDFFLSGQTTYITRPSPPPRTLRRRFLNWLQSG